MKVAAVARTNVVTCFPTTPIREVAELILAKNIGSVVVVDPANPTKPVGIVGERDLLKAYVAGMDPSTPVREIMSKLIITVDADAHIGEALLLMKEANVRRLVVTKGGELYGVVALRDIVYNIPLLKILADYFSK
ncbi:CBS domain-containing protein [Pyrobaculum ferrireducens]|uniref:Putative signal-transduction protein with CBS domains n=1 Tax=Pyrobaculum ferrireducens TaxID=1104324 RepID=G7VDR0_9CREN|nr:CBS domain-containing protein [Pyrobaculum ferrireducens]AET34039.1 putative signal-transduction protein with CBS domains [Pyrobaculum ferrireducens]